MTRKKVRLAFMANDSARKATFKKRKKGLIKKVSELSTLCGIQACAIIYSPYDSQPEVWPSPYGVQQVLSQFKKMPEMEQSKKMVNQESFLRQRIGKAKEQLKKHRKENCEKEITQVMFHGLTGKSLINLNIIDLNDLRWLIDQNLKDIIKKINLMKVNDNPSPNPNPNPNPNLNTDHNPNANGDNNTNYSQAEVVAVSIAVSAAASSVAEGGGGEETVVVAEPPPGFEVNVDSMQRQQWFMDLINPPDQLGFGGGSVGGADELLLSFSDQNNGLWSNAFFP